MFFLIQYVGGISRAKRVVNWIQQGAGAQVTRAGALGLAPFGLCLLPVASRVF